MAAGALIGVDVGGTHTDVCVSAGGDLVRGKALTTHDDYSLGVVEAIGVSADEVRLPRPDIGLEGAEMAPAPQLAG